MMKGANTPCSVRTQALFTTLRNDPIYTPRPNRGGGGSGAAFAKGKGIRRHYIWSTRTNPIKSAVEIEASLTYFQTPSLRKEQNDWLLGASSGWHKAIRTWEVHRSESYNILVGEQGSPQTRQRKYMPNLRLKNIDYFNAKRWMGSF
jgi:hypothetical protein